MKTKWLPWDWTVSSTILTLLLHHQAPPLPLLLSPILLEKEHDLRLSSALYVLIYSSFSDIIKNSAASLFMWHINAYKYTQPQTYASIHMHERAYMCAYIFSHMQDDKPFMLFMCMQDMCETRMIYISSEPNHLTIFSLYIPQCSIIPILYIKNEIYSNFPLMGLPSLCHLLLAFSSSLIFFFHNATNDFVTSLFFKKITSYSRFL